jgi:hypothetical protein
MNDQYDLLKQFISDQFPKMGGWCDAEKGFQIGKLVLDSKPQKIAEVGVFEGKSTLALAKACKMSGSWSSWTQEGLTGRASAAIRHEVLKFPPRHSRLRLGRTTCPRLRERLHPKYLNTAIAPAAMHRPMPSPPGQARPRRAARHRRRGIFGSAAVRCMRASRSKHLELVCSSNISEELVPCVENVSAVSGGKKWGPAGPGGVMQRQLLGYLRKPRFSYRCDDTALKRCGNVPAC